MNTYVLHGAELDHLILTFSGNAKAHWRFHLILYWVMF
jgi:hypothetical protein